MLRIIGDDIYFEGVKVAVLTPKVQPSLRDRFERILDSITHDFERRKRKQKDNPAMSEELL